MSLRTIYFFLFYTQFLVTLNYIQLLTDIIIPHWKFPMLKPYTKAGVI